MVTDAVPELMSKREGRLLSLGLRARVSVLKFVDPTMHIKEKGNMENIKIKNLSSRQLLSCCVQNILKISRLLRPTSPESDLLALRR